MIWFDRALSAFISGIIFTIVVQVSYLAQLGFLSRWFYVICIVLLALSLDLFVLCWKGQSICKILKDKYDGEK